MCLRNAAAGLQSSLSTAESGVSGQPSCSLSSAQLRENIPLPGAVASRQAGRLPGKQPRSQRFSVSQPVSRHYPAGR